MVTWLVVALLSAAPDAGASGSGQQREKVCAKPRVADRSCTTDADCMLIKRNVDCCGTETVSGINRNDLASEQAFQKACGVPRTCRCMAAPTRLDDGSTLDKPGQVRATCVANVCTTSQVRLETCSAQECGPAPTYPTGGCPDGVNRSGRGPCARVEGVCRWTRLECPR